MLNQRTITTILFGIIMATSAIFGTINMLINGPNLTNTVALVATVVHAALLVAHLRGWQFASRLLLLVVAAATLIGTKAYCITHICSILVTRVRPRPHRRGGGNRESVVDNPIRARLVEAASSASSAVCALLGAFPTRA